MPLDTREVLSVVNILAEEKNLRVTVSESMKGGLVAGCTAAVGGLLLGPIGLAVGGAVGGCLAASMAKKFKPVAQVILEMRADEQVRLAASVTNIVQHMRPEDYASLLALVMGNQALKVKILQQVILFLQNEFRMHVID